MGSRKGPATKGRRRGRGKEILVRVHDGGGGRRGEAAVVLSGTTSGPRRDPGARQAGPLAQDFHAAIALGALAALAGLAELRLLTAGLTGRPARQVP